MQQYSNDYSPFRYEVDVRQGLNAYISKVFSWMFVGLVITTVVSLVVSTSVNILVFLAENMFLLFGLLIGEIILVAVLSRRIMKLSFGAAFSMFLIYAAVNGVTLSIIFVSYTMESIWSTFLITAVTFGIMALYGRFTKTDLTQFRSVLFMGLIGLLVLSVVNIFLKSGPLGWIISIIGLFVFLGLTAYDTQKLIGYYHATEGQEAIRKNLGVMGALALYLDFINLFLKLLRLFGRRR